MSALPSGGRGPVAPNVGQSQGALSPKGPRAPSAPSRCGMQSGGVFGFPWLTEYAQNAAD